VISNKARHVEECPRRSRRWNPIVIFVVNERELNRAVEDQLLSLRVLQSVPRKNVNLTWLGQ
jgi:hypothetical protein